MEGGRKHPGLSGSRPFWDALGRFWDPLFFALFDQILGSIWVIFEVTLVVILGWIVTFYILKEKMSKIIEVHCTRKKETGIA